MYHLRKFLFHVSYGLGPDLKQLYASFLATLSAFRYSKHAAYHLTALLLATFAIYVYRDIYPLRTYNQDPADLSEGKLLWPMICALGITAIVIPLFTPRAYSPVDPEVNDNHTPIFYGY